MAEAASLLHEHGRVGILLPSLLPSIEILDQRAHVLGHAIDLTKPGDRVQHTDSLPFSVRHIERLVCLVAELRMQDCNPGKP